ncbi:MAG: DUF3054 domain-containing protein [Chloroflexi bacterium]|nr:DUF3054 domain-containing protein [Chloroflexota bacterium]
MWRKPVDVWVLLSDVSALIIFAAIGRQSHHETNPITAILATAAPFIIGWLAIAWPAGLLQPQPLWAWLGRTLAWNIVGCSLGLILRSIWLQREIPLSFALVSLGVTTLVLLIARMIHMKRIPKDVAV